MAASTGCAAGAQSTDTLHKLDVAGIERSYRLYAPAKAVKRASANGPPLPLMIVLHGGLGNAQSIEDTSGMDQVADDGGFVVAYPNGTEGLGRMQGRRTWNAGRCCGIASRENVDDVGFIEQLISEIANQYPIDRTRVYAVGISNGGMLAYRLACEIPDRLAAAVAIAGTLAIPSCPSSNSVAFLHIHGDADRNIPLQGGRGSRGLARVDHRSVADSISALTKNRDCETSEKSLPNGDRETTYTCHKGAPVEVLILSGASHGWPGAGGRKGAESSFPASQAAWDFVRSHQSHRSEPKPTSD
ncbi:alpha/beta hydrolase-fold protein [Myxococcota bacterium]|nr:alpha/beta hydrolase-fold protein [Myxococcota bacterium]